MADGDGASDDRIIPLSEEPKNGEWLIKIMKGKNPQSRPKPRIQRVDITLREIKSNETCFDPLVVSFGPYHHGKPRLMPMENHKEVAARWFVSLANNNLSADAITESNARATYDQFVVEATKESSPRDCYADKFEFKDFMRMMFLDGCFILHFMHLVVKCSDELSKSSHLNQPLILRDMFLLENQVPYSILKALMSLMPDKSMESNVENFIDMVFLLQHETPQSRSECLTNAISFLTEMFSSLTKKKESTVGGSNSADRGKDNMPFHLLDFLQSKLIGNSANSSSSGSGYWSYYFRSIIELKAAGIKIGRSNSKYLKDIQFRSGIFNGHLQLPQFMVDDATKTRLLNLIAYEMCPDGLSDRAVTSYICFLDSLIDHAEDVKELRSKNILLNRLGSDEEVANLFNELANNLTPNCNTYSDVMKNIQKHSGSHVKVWIAEFMHTHFTSPWTVLALMAAIFVIALTVVQTVYSVVVVMYLPLYSIRTCQEC
ncbi:upf0481 protein [Cinnamomum micranthum f. kanehirae]|uniref:Upf0481 protein n=1 Tax=Cinnamomum micranthum f. kanehirae TaxID=337451 RepID=A0A3S3MJ22_9MAGN|nr:upf0481 protein [Cinnamomum micranthum f. kanehirae]